MDTHESDDHFERMALHHAIERSRGLIADYQESMAYYHGEIEKAQHHLGRLDERLAK